MKSRIKLSSKRVGILDGDGDAADGQLREFAQEAVFDLVDQFAFTFLWRANNVAALPRQRQCGLRHKT